MIFSPKIPLQNGETPFEIVHINGPNEGAAESGIFQPNHFVGDTLNVVITPPLGPISWSHNCAVSRQLAIFRDQSAMFCSSFDCSIEPKFCTDTPVDM